MAGDTEPDELDALLDAYTAQAEQEKHFAALHPNLVPV